MQHHTTLVHPRIAGASLLLICALLGVFVSGFLTFLKFQSSFTCDSSLLSACQIGEWLSCKNALTSTWSTFPWIVPISIYGAAYYLSLGYLSLQILRRPTKSGPVACAFIVLIAWLGLLATAPLGLYAARIGFCSFCTVLYLLNISIVLLAALMSPRGIRDAVHAAKASGRSSILVGATAGLVFISSTLVQAVLYIRHAQDMDADRQCVVPYGDIPETGLVVGSETPTVEISLFIDLSCPICRQDFTDWLEVVEANEEYRLKVFHFPRDGDCAADSYHLESQQHHACMAARAVECAESLYPAQGAGLRLTEALFAFHDTESGEFFTESQIAAVAQEVITADPENPTDQFSACLEADNHALGRIRSHAVFAEQHGLTETPGVFLTFFEAGEPLPKMLMIRGRKNYLDVHTFIENAHSRVRTALTEEGEQP